MSDSNCRRHWTGSFGSTASSSRTRATVRKGAPSEIYWVLSEPNVTMRPKVSTPLRDWTDYEKS